MIGYIIISVVVFATFFLLTNKSIRDLFVDLYLSRKVRKNGMIELGDAVQSQIHTGKVIGFKPFFFQIQTGDSVVTVPYRLVFDESFKRFYSGKLYACINSDAEIQYVETLMEELALMVPLIMKVPKPSVKLSHVSASGLVFEVTYWCKFPNKESFILEHFEQAAKEQFKYQGIEAGTGKEVFIRGIGLENM